MLSMFIQTILKKMQKLPGLVAFQNILSSFVFILVLLLSTSLFAQTSQQSESQPNNALLNHNSDYLAMHAQDPVHWQIWDSTTLQQAQKANKLVFISSGYFACHWCHVMQQENYQNPTTAEYLNQHFIPVKIDRELNPELDKTLIEFAKKTTGQAGWPQHVILTPDGYPFAAFIYLPNRAFQKTLKRVVTLWQLQPEAISLLAQNASQTVQSKPIKKQSTSITANAFEERLFHHLTTIKDDFSGGLKGTSKFPKAPLLNALLAIENLPAGIEEWLIVTLDHIQNEHLFDHINSGFYRYTVDPNWQIPHFEKMTYDNALLATTFLTAGKKYNRPDYITTAKDTLNYLQNHLYSPKTQLYRSSQSAIDLNKREGGDYLLSKAQLKNKLTDTEYQLLDQAWLLGNPPPYELGWHPLPIEPIETWQVIRNKLQTPIEQIPIDKKSILGWNGLVLSAFSQAWQVLREPQYQNQAQQLATKLSKLIQNDSPPRAIADNGQLMGEANLQDYAFILNGLKDYQHDTDDQQFNDVIHELKTTIPKKFYDDSGWQYGASKILPQQQGEWIMADGSIPSPTALISCDMNKTIRLQSVNIEQDKLLAQPVNYPSYLATLKCIQ
ncbi:thioredoxin [Thiomicrorhabdus immobilis]|uniref:Thioredoxin n=1 Tax=Thiomicrorhabdus immobilis TaxID=2791037 RepID=A0ABM7MAM9_9GAMM|nr:DUF255 domain-containing protein [Thiomicrorhabdus immobilis]BCN92402.1 thioredoxin [Thiomicrorhabdus immobilis]